MVGHKTSGVEYLGPRLLERVTQTQNIQAKPKKVGMESYIQ